MRAVFFISLAIWLIGYILAGQLGTVLFGPIAVTLGIIWAIKSVIRPKNDARTSAPSDASVRPTGIPHVDAMMSGTKIYSLANVDKAAASACEVALQDDMFSPLGVDSEGRHVLHMLTPGQDYVALVKQQSSPPFGDALVVVAAYPVTKDEARQLGTELAAL